MTAGTGAGDVEPAAAFLPSALDGCPPTVARYFARSIPAGTPLSAAVHVSMRGLIRIGPLWLPFRAVEILAPRRGFTWAARVAGVIRGKDVLEDGDARMHWALGGAATLVDEDGPDLARSAAGRCGAESIWAPTAVLPGGDVRWSSDEPGAVSARFPVGDTQIEVRHRVDAEGLLRSTSMKRWGDPDRTGTWGMHSFGGQFTSSRTFGGITVPDRGRIGWFPGTPRWADGEFFRFRVTALRPLSAAEFDGLASSR